MKRNLSIALILVLALTALPLAAQQTEVVKKKYEKMESLRIDLVLGDCRIVASSDAKLHVRLEYTYSDENYEPRFRERSDKLIVEEKFYGNNPRGYARWEIRVPKGLEIDYESATGDLLIEGIESTVEGETGTGDIELSDCSGRFRLNSGTGDVRLLKGEGEFDLQSGTGDVIIETVKGNVQGHSGTGDVEATDLTLEYEGIFESGTGDAEVKAPKGTDYDLEISSGTGKAILDLAGQPLRGSYELQCSKRHGRIRSDVDFDHEREVGRGEETTLIKSLKRGGDTPRHTVSTGTGTATLKK